MIFKKIHKNINLINKAINEIKFLSPKLLLSTSIYCICDSLFPFISMCFLSFIVSELSGNANLRLIIIYVVVALLMNSIVFLIKEIFSGINKYGFDMLYGKELNSVTDKLIDSNYESIDNTEYQSIIAKHNESLNQSGGALTILTHIISAFFSGILSIIISIVILLPFFKTLFLKTGTTFIERPIFLIFIIACMLLGSLIVFFISLVASKKKYKLQNEFYDVNNIFNYYTDMLTNYKTGKEIRIFKEQKLIEKQTTNQLFKIGINVQSKICKCQAISNSITVLIGCILGFGIYLIVGLKGLYGVVSIGAIIRYLGSFIQLAQGISNLSSNLGMLGNIIPSLNYYFDVFDKQISQNDNGDVVCPTGDFVIEFKNVSFKYPNSGQNALNNVSFKIQSGERIAIVGENGSGKTTIIKLLCRLYKVDSGAILLNGINILEYDYDEYRKLFSVVFQDFNIFSLPLGQTIASNTVYDEKKIESCLKQADMYSTVMGMPNTYDTYLFKDCDKDGIEISGGEAQKIAISRAIYKDSPIMILDEPTASLDPLAEYKLYSKFNDLVKHKTTIYISHRLSSCRFCSRVMVLDFGEVVQDGSHENLIQDLSGKYYQLWNAQAKYYNV